MKASSPASDAAVVVVGSLHHDMMVRAPRQPVTGETLAGSHWFAKFGGKGGNQAVAARRAGADVRLLGAVGRDGFGDYLLDALARADVSRRFVEVLDDHGSGMSVATVDDDGDYAAVIVSGANLHIDPARLDEPALWDGASLLLLQNEVPESLDLAAARRAREIGLKVCLNAAPARMTGGELEALVDVLVVNAIEAEAMLGASVTNLGQARAAADALLARGFESVIVTAGGDGAAVASSRVNEGVFVVPAKEVEVIGTHGAGDVFTGTLCAALVRGDSLRDATFAASEAAARHVGSPHERERASSGGIGSTSSSALSNAESTSRTRS